MNCLLQGDFLIHQQLPDYGMKQTFAQFPAVQPRCLTLTSCLKPSKLESVPHGLHLMHASFSRSLSRTWLE